MKIELKEITIRDLTEGYSNDAVEGVTGYDGNLDIRPKYQREFVYKDKQRDAVIATVKADFPLNVMYWVKKDDGGYEVLDGQQRTISICEYVSGTFSIDYQYFHNLEQVEQDQILDYKMMVYFCEGDSKEKLDWFRTINIAGEKLTDQELRNAIYSGAWLSDAKRYFSKPQCAAYGMGSDYLRGSPIRQEYLETSLKWLSDDNVEQYMAQHQHDPNASGLWLYFTGVINWVQATFPKYRKEMKGVNFGALYNEFKDETLDTNALEVEITGLMRDEDVTKKAGIYSYVLTREEKHLSIRAFTTNQKREAYESQDGVCPSCDGDFEISGMEGDHITPWHEGGTTTPGNCQMLCKGCNRTKGGK